MECKGDSNGTITCHTRCTGLQSALSKYPVSTHIYFLSLHAFTAKSLVLETDGKQKPLCFIIHTNTFILLVFSLLCYTHHISTHQLPMLSVYKDIFCCKDGKSNKRGEITRDLFIYKSISSEKKTHSRK